MPSLEFYMAHEAEQFVFYRIPKILFTDKRFSKISSDAKLLYSLFLDRMSLSKKNGLIDEEKRVYIYFSVEEVQEEFGVASQKAIKMIAELDDIKGCGLIHRKKQGQGKPTKIYVMKYTSENKNEVPEKVQCEDIETNDTSEDGKLEESMEGLIIEGALDNPQIITHSHQNSRISESESQEFRNSKIQTCENQNSRLLKNTKQDFRKSKGNNNKYNNTEINNTDFNDINPILSNHSDYNRAGLPNSDVMDEMDKRRQYRELILENIEYEILLERNYDKEEIDGLVDIMLDLVCSNKDYVFINGADMPKEVVKSRMLKIGFEHIEYVMDCLRKNTTKVRNIKSYLTTSLYNAPTTIGSYYTAEVNHDLYGTGRENLL